MSLFQVKGETSLYMFLFQLTAEHKMLSFHQSLCMFFGVYLVSFMTNAKWFTESSYVTNKHQWGHIAVSHNASGEDILLWLWAMAIKTYHPVNYSIGCDTCLANYDNID